MTAPAEQTGERPERVCRTVAACDVTGGSALYGRAVEEIVDAVAAMQGAGAADVVRSRGVGMLHAVIDASEIGALRDRVLDRLRDDLLRFAVSLGRSVLGWDGEFYVDDYLILRVNFPYAVARASPPGAENPGVGRLSPAVRATAAARRVRDPRYAPASYHRGHPPAAWAHGPHVDSWTGHSKDGLNVWWAISDVPAEAGMVLYPDVDVDALDCDPCTLYLRAGTRLPEPTVLPLEAGTMIVFDPEVLHGTHLNVTDRTRVALSLRLNAHEPRFDPNCFYAREFWRRASDVSAGSDTVLHLRREAHLAQVPLQSARAAAPPRAPAAVTAAVCGGKVEIDAALLREQGDPLVVEADGRRIGVVRRAGGVFAFDAACPHYGLDLTCGNVSASGVRCPGCAVSFDFATGASATPALSMTTFAAHEHDGRVTVDLGA